MTYWAVEQDSTGYVATERVCGRDDCGPHFDRATGAELVRADTLDGLRAALANPPYRATYKLRQKGNLPGVIEAWTI